MEANPQDEFDTSDFPPISPQPSQKPPPSPPRITTKTSQPTPPNQPKLPQNQSAWNTPLHQTPQIISIEQLQQCLQETRANSKLAENQQKELEETKNLLDSSNKLVF